MKTNNRSIPLLLAIGALAISCPTSATAANPHPYVVLHDDGTLEGQVISNPAVLEDLVISQYQATGQPMPNFITIWTTFAFNKSTGETRFDPLGNDVSGIGLENEYGGTGVMASPYAPLRSLTIHNDVTKLAERAAAQKAPLEGFAEYLFLLDFSHNWGPAILVPGDRPSGLLGSPFHWSFWMDAGGSPAGGNAWKDGGAGQYTIAPRTFASIQFSLLDLYLMGMAPSSEVPPFSVLLDPVAPTAVKDPFTGKVYNAASFPWVGTTPFTASASSRQTFSIDDVIAKNGVRTPAFGTAATTFDLGIVLLVSANATAEQEAAYKQVFDGVAPRLAPAFNAATRGRGTLNVVTSTPDTPASMPDMAMTTVSPVGSSSGCAIGGRTRAASPAWLPLVLLMATACVRLRSSRGRG